MKNQLIILFLCFSLFSAGQEEDKGYCKVIKIKKDNSISQGQAKLVIQFSGPTGKAVSSRIQLLVNTDTIVPVINEKGVYSTTLPPGNYSFTFLAPWWYPVQLKALSLQAATCSELSVHFEAREYRLDD